MSDQTGMREFQELVNDCDLTDLSFTGPNLTWWNNQDENPIGKKLDRVLVNCGWQLAFPRAAVSFETNGISDHTRSVVNISNTQHRKKRHHFQFFNFLADLPQFLEIVSDVWGQYESLYHSRTALSRLHQKLKLLKSRLWMLNKEKYSDITKRTKIAFDVLCAHQEDVLRNPCADSIRAEHFASQQWNHYSDIEEKFFQQKSHIQWLKHGDRNTPVFHRAVQSRQSRNAIRKLVTADGTTLTDADDIKREAVGYYENFLNATSEIQETDGSLLSLQTLLQYRCSDDIASMLTKEVNTEEILETLKRLPSNKTPGPDGFTKEFFLKAWPIIGQDVVVAIQSFFLNGFMPKGVNATVLALIPKKVDAELMKDFRPISCCNTIYKIVSKILARRIKALLPDAILPNQSAFVHGRLLLENVLLATELVKDYHKDNISSRWVLKLDITKAFDTVSWGFLSNMLAAMDLPDIFREWLKGCITKASFTVNVNGELEGFFSSSRGLRQGCSISPLLFVLAINVLSQRLNKAAEDGRFNYHPKCKDLHITHLSFADDLMVFTDGTARSLRGIAEVLQEFQSESGLAINMQKSALYMAGKTNSDLQALAVELDLPIDQLPIRYLGLPLTTKRMTRADYEPLIDRIRSRFNAWSNKSLSYVGRLQLIQSVIASIANFWSSAFRLPQSCFDKIQSMCSVFLWSGNPNITTKTKVAWSDLTIPKREGGLGLRKLEDSSRLFMLKLIWILFQNENSLWVAWTRHYLLRQVSFWDIQLSSTRGSWMWRKLLRFRPIAAQFMRKEIRNGLSTHFWFDNWISIGPLHTILGDMGPRLLGIRRNDKVVDAVNGNEWKRWRVRSPQVRLVVAQIQSSRVPHVDEGSDLVLWKQRQDCYDSKFSLKRTWNLLRQSHQAVPWKKLVWFTQALPRQSFIHWLAFRDRLPTGNRLMQWGSHQSCPLCGEMNETRDHLFMACPYSFSVWMNVASQLLGSRISPDWEHTVSTLLHNRLPPLDKRLVIMVFQTTIYWLWKERNGRIHNAPHHSVFFTTRTICKEMQLRLRPSEFSEDYEGSALRRWSLISNNYSV